MEGGINLEHIINGYKMCLETLGEIDNILQLKGFSTDRVKVERSIAAINSLRNSLPRDIISKE